MRLFLSLSEIYNNSTLFLLQCFFTKVKDFSSEIWYNVMGCDTMDYDKIVEEELENLPKNNLEKVGNLYLTKYQQQVLDKYHISYQTCESTKELLFLLSDIVDEEEYDDLEAVASEIAEFSYYHETRK